MNDHSRNLLRLMEMIKDVELMRLAEIAARQDELSGQIATLEQSRADRANAISGLEGLDAALLSGADSRWSAWLAAEAKRLEAVAAVKMAERDQQFAIAQRAFGRAQTLAGLLQKKDAP